MAATTAYHEGQRLSYDSHLCTVRYIGAVKGTKGEWLGVEWDDAERGKHSGIHGGERYFDCLRKASTPASFVRPSRAHDGRRTFVEALREKYAPQEALDPGEDLIKISGKDVEEVGFDKIRQQQAELQKLRIIVLNGCRIGRSEVGSEDNSALMEDIQQICPLCEQLDISRNLFETWDEILALVSQLPHLTTLILDGNHFEVSSQIKSPKALNAVRRLSVNECLFDWPKTTRIVQEFPELTELSASRNGLRGLTPHLLPAFITVINLESNDFVALADLSSLANLPSLERLSLKHNEVSRIYHNDAVPTPHDRLQFPATLTDVDLSGNQIGRSEFVNDLVAVMPGLESLRLSGNPLYDSLRSIDGTKLHGDDAFMLTLARIKPLTMLNYSKITPKDRLNAETYYLAQIGRELSVVPEPDTAAILKQHPRYQELCSEYGAPVVVRKAQDEVNPNSLAARLVRCTIRLDPVMAATTRESFSLTPEVLELEIPRSFTIYNVIGLVSKRFHLQPTTIKLIWETGEPGFILKADESSESDSEEDDAIPRNRENTSHQLQPTREEHLYPLTKRLGTWLEASVAKLRVERLRVP